MDMKRRSNPQHSPRPLRGRKQKQRLPLPMYYMVLGLAQDATDDDIHRAYRRLTTLSRPDDHPANRRAARQLRTIAEAHEVLGDPVRRAAYDAQLSGGTRPVPRLVISPSSAASTPSTPPVSEPAPVDATPVNQAQRPARVGWVWRHRAGSASIVILLTLLVIGAVEWPQRTRTSRPVLTPPLGALPSAHGPVVAAVAQPVLTAKSPHRTAQVHATGPSRPASVAAPAIRRALIVRPNAHRHLRSLTTTRRPLQRQIPVRTHVPMQPVRGKGDGTPLRHRASPYPHTVAHGSRVPGHRKTTALRRGVPHPLVVQVPRVDELTLADLRPHPVPSRSRPRADGRPLLVEWLPQRLQHWTRLGGSSLRQPHAHPYAAGQRPQIAFPLRGLLRHNRRGGRYEPFFPGRHIVRERPADSGWSRLRA